MGLSSQLVPDHVVTKTDPGGINGPPIGPPMSAGEQRKQKRGRYIVVSGCEDASAYEQSLEPLRSPWMMLDGTGSLALSMIIGRSDGPRPKGPSGLRS